MPTVEFDRDSWAKWYAIEHLKTDPGIDAVWYLPMNSGEREIRLVEVNHLVGDRTDEALEPIEFGVDKHSEDSHTLFVLDVTPSQWERIHRQELALPRGWSLDGMARFLAEHE